MGDHKTSGVHISRDAKRQTRHLGLCTDPGGIVLVLMFTELVG